MRRNGPSNQVLRRFFARCRGCNANQVFAWRKLYREGLLDDELSNSLLPVKISKASAALQAVKGAPTRSTIAGLSISTSVTPGCGLKERPTLIVCARP